MYCDLASKHRKRLGGLKYVDLPGMTNPFDSDLFHFFSGWFQPSSGQWTHRGWFEIGKCEIHNARHLIHVRAIALPKHHQAITIMKQATSSWSLPLFAGLSFILVVCRCLLSFCEILVSFIVVIVLPRLILLILLIIAFNIVITQQHGDHSQQVTQLKLKRFNTQQQEQQQEVGWIMRLFHNYSIFIQPRWFRRFRYVLALLLEFASLLLNTTYRTTYHSTIVGCIKLDLWLSHCWCWLYP